MGVTTKLIILRIVAMNRFKRLGSLVIERKPEIVVISGLEFMC